MVARFRLAWPAAAAEDPGRSPVSRTPTNWKVAWFSIYLAKFERPFASRPTTLLFSTAALADSSCKFLRNRSLKSWPLRQEEHREVLLVCLHSIAIEVPISSTNHRGRSLCCAEWGCTAGCNSNTVFERGVPV